MSQLLSQAAARPVDQPVINLIWAQARSLDGRPGVIGYQGSMPWHLPEDLRHFVQLTTPHPVIMGQATWDSLAPRFRPLPDRFNIVLTRDEELVTPGAVTAHSIPEALTLAGKRSGQVWVVGGASLYSQFLPLATVAEITEIDAEVPADTFAPDIRALVQTGEWALTAAGDWQVPAQSPSIRRYRFLTYRRASPLPGC